MSTDYRIKFRILFGIYFRTKKYSSEFHAMNIPIGRFPNSDRLMLLKLPRPGNNDRHSFLPFRIRHKCHKTE